MTTGVTIPYTARRCQPRCSSGWAAARAHPVQAADGDRVRRHIRHKGLKPLISVPHLNGGQLVRGQLTGGALQEHGQRIW